MLWLLPISVPENTNIIYARGGQHRTYEPTAGIANRAMVLANPLSQTSLVDNLKCAHWFKSPHQLVLNSFLKWFSGVLQLARPPLYAIDNVQIFFLTDINECELVMHNCSDNAECVNLDGTYQCMCEDGYFDGSGSGLNCSSETEHMYIHRI